MVVPLPSLPPASVIDPLLFGSSYFTAALSRLVTSPATWFATAFSWETFTASESAVPAATPVI